MYNGSAIHWSLRRQHLITHSSTESEFIAASKTGCKLCYYRHLSAELSSVITFPTSPSSPVKFFCDNQSTIKNTINTGVNGRTKHLDIRYKFIQELMEQGEI